jgi:hypothetical protein
MSCCIGNIEFLDSLGLVVNKNLTHSYGIKHSKPTSTTYLTYNPQKVVYLYSSLVETVRSLYRRNIKTISYFYDNANTYFNPIKNEQIRVPKFDSFQDYINAVVSTNSEPLGIVNHWNDWKTQQNVLFLKYSDIPTSPNIDTYLDLPVGTCTAFKIRERWERMDIETDQYINILNNIDATQRV